MADRISVAVVNNKVDNLAKNLDDFKTDMRGDVSTLRQEMKDGNRAILDAVNAQQKSNEETYVKKQDFAPFRAALVATGTVVLAMVIFIIQQLFTKGVKW